MKKYSFLLLSLLTPVIYAFFLHKGISEGNELIIIGEKLNYQFIILGMIVAGIGATGYYFHRDSPKDPLMFVSLLSWLIFFFVSNKLVQCKFQEKVEPQVLPSIYPDMELPNKLCFNPNRSLERIWV